MIESLFILADTGEVLFEKQWGGKGGDRSVCRWFFDLSSGSGRYAAPEDVPAVIAAPQSYVLHILRGGITFLACTRIEMPPLLGIEFLQSVANVLGDYVGGLCEDNLKDNFVAVYEVLDEMMDAGFPLTTEPNALKELVPPPSVVNRMFNVMTGVAASGPYKAPSAIPSSVGSAIPWRGTDIRHVSNEIYCDIMEELDVVIDRNGSLLRSAIFGEVQVTSRLSGLPDVNISVANPSILSDVQLHRCIRSHIWEAERSLACIPPDGHCTLMSYRVKDTSNIPLYVNPQLSFHDDMEKLSVVVGLKSDPGKPIEGVEVEVPLSMLAVSADLTTNHGTVLFDHISKKCTWTVGKLPKDKVPSMTGTVKLEGDGRRSNARPSLLVKFRVPGVALSGLRIENINVTNENYRPYKGLRALTKAGCFEVRT